jgi:ATP-dependent Clp protease adaptor protein ClpS
MFHPGAIAPAYHASVTDTREKPKTSTRPEQETQTPWLWRVVLLDDDDHSYEYVIEMMQKVFAFPFPKAYEIAKAVDAQGRAVCMVTHKEHAELKRDQIHSYGPDRRIEACCGAMSAIIEPAEGDEGGDGDEPGQGGGRDA